MVYFGSNLRKLRQSKKWTQDKMATLLNARPNTISNYETGTSYPDFNTLVTIIKLFDINADTLLFKDLTEGSEMSHEARSQAGATPSAEKNIYEQRLADKDKVIAALEDSVALYRDMYQAAKSSQARG
ncbi:helix-turn-helix domain-containing protein [Spirosoma areae]